MRFRRALEDILQYPELNRRVWRDVRQKNLQRFPYGLVYRLRDQEITIYAFTHLSRRPGCWKGRLRDVD